MNNKGEKNARHNCLIGKDKEEPTKGNDKVENPMAQGVALFGHHVHANHLTDCRSGGGKSEECVS